MASVRGDVSRATFVTAGAVQEYLNIDRSTVYRMASDGRLPAIKVGRQWRFPVDAIRQLVSRDSAIEAFVDAANRPALVDPTQRVQEVCDLIARLFDVTVSVVDIEGRRIGEPSNPSGLERLLEGHVLARRQREQVLRELIGRRSTRLAPDSLGLLTAASHVRDDTEIVGAVTVSGVAPRQWPPALTTMEGYAEGLAVSAEGIVGSVDQVHHLDEATQDLLVQALPPVAELLSTLLSAGGASRTSSGDDGRCRCAS